MKKLLFKLLAGPVGRVIGHNNLVRYGQFITRSGRLDYPNDMNENGEILVQSTVIKAAGDNPIVAVDCGANVGDWTKELCNYFSETDNSTLTVYCFEPSHFTYQKLRETVEIILETSRKEIIVTPVNKALSSSNDKSVLSVVHAGAGTNTLVPMPGVDFESKEQVSLITLDLFTEERTVPEITFLKIDAEGHDAEVLKGARRLIMQKRISVIQFEYNWRWIYSQHLLQEVYLNLTQAGYHIGKITPKGILFYSDYNIGMETFEEANYLACTSEWLEKFPKVDRNNNIVVGPQ